MATDEQIAAMDTRIEELEDQLGDLREQLLRAQLEQWQARVEDLEVQLKLGSMEVDDRIAPLVERLRNSWLDAQEKVGATPSTASDVLDTLWGGLEQAMKDIRNAVMDAKSTVIG